MKYFVWQSISVDNPNSLEIGLMQMTLVYTFVFLFSNKFRILNGEKFNFTLINLLHFLYLELYDEKKNIILSRISYTYFLFLESSGGKTELIVEIAKVFIHVHLISLYRPRPGKCRYITRIIHSSGSRVRTTFSWTPARFY